MNNQKLQEICHQVGREFGMVSLASGISSDYAKEVAKRFAKESKPKKVFVVTSGSYSDYSIDAIFYDERCTEVWELDSPGLKVPGRAFSVEMEKDGYVVDARVEDSLGMFTESKDGIFTISTFFNFYGSKSPVLNNYCFAKDIEHAIKITNKLRIRLLIENKWGEK